MRVSAVVFEGASMGKVIITCLHLLVGGVEEEHFHNESLVVIISQHISDESVVERFGLTLGSDWGSTLLINEMLVEFLKLHKFKFGTLNQ